MVAYYHVFIMTYLRENAKTVSVNAKEKSILT